MEKITKKTGKIAFIGGGAMAEAIIKGILATKLAEAKDISVGDPTQSRCELLTENYGVKTSTNNLDIVSDAGLIVLAVKPQVIDQAMTEIFVKQIPKDATIISIMGSVDLEKLHSLIPKHAIIRVMPNTPLAVGAGMTAIAPDSKSSNTMIDAVKTIFGACGEVEVVSENAIEAITAVSGCGPGYVFMMIDALADAGVNAGLPRNMAIKLAAQTFAGSGKMVLETGLHPAQLKDQVTSPGGTTIAGIHALEVGGVRAAMYNAVIAVLERSEKLKGK